MNPTSREPVSAAARSAGPGSPPTPRATPTPSATAAPPAGSRTHDAAREREQTQLFLDAKLDLLQATSHAEAERLEATRIRRLLDERRHPMNPD
jgi:hypothetical protein